MLAGIIPATATKQSHPAERAIAKTLVIALLYGMAAPTLALKSGVSAEPRTRPAQVDSAYTYRKFQRWSDERIYRGRWKRSNGNCIRRRRLAVDHRTKSGTLRNFGVQGCVVQRFYAWRIASSTKPAFRSAFRCTMRFSWSAPRGIWRKLLEKSDSRWNEPAKSFSKAGGFGRKLIYFATPIGWLNRVV